MTNLNLFHFMAFGFASGLGYGLLRIAWINLDGVMAAVAHKKLPLVVPCPLCHHRAPFCACEPCTHEKIDPEFKYDPRDRRIGELILQGDALRKELDDACVELDSKSSYIRTILLGLDSAKAELEDARMELALWRSAYPNANPKSS